MEKALRKRSSSMLSRNPRNPEATLYKALTRVLSGPITRRRQQIPHKLKGYQLAKYRFKSLSGQEFKREQYNPFTDLSTNYMQNQNRLERYSEFDQMEFDPILASAIDIYSDEMTTCSTLEPLLKVLCPNEEIKIILETLYHDVLNVDYNLYYWARSMVKYGDFFLYLDVDEKMGIKYVIGLPNIEIERIEGSDPTNPEYVQYQWNIGSTTFENWQVAHFRILGNDKYAPYGTSVLEPARRIWRQLMLLEDAVMAYRIVRSPERRVFKIDVGNIPPEDVEQYVQKAITNLKRNQIIDPEKGRVDLRYNPLCDFPNDYVYLTDGSSVQFKNLPKLLEEKKDKVYAWSLDKENNIVPTKVLWAGITKEKTKFAEIELDDGQIIKTTYEHKWLLRDGTKIQAKDLKVGDSLMPFYSQYNDELTKRHGARNNPHIKLYHPGKSLYESAHKLVGKWKYGDYKWPNIIHHIDHIKYNNNPDNLLKLTTSEHAKIHEETTKLLIEYARSDIGRQKSSEIMKEVHRKYDFHKIAKQTWSDKKIRQKRIDSLTFKTDSTLIRFVLDAINSLGTESREHEIRGWLNNNNEFQNYLLSLNPDFKNGFNNKLNKMQFLKHLRNQNFNNLRAVKDFYVAIKAPWDKIINYVQNNKIDSRKSIFNYFGISKYDFTLLVKNHGLTLQEFDQQYLSGGFQRTENIICKNCNKEFSGWTSENRKYCSHECYSKALVGIKRNHKVVAVRFPDEECEAYGVTVENSTHTIAIGGENADFFKTGIWKSGVFICQSVEEDYFLPIRGAGDNTTIETLQGGNYTGDIEDIQYLKDKLFAAIKIPQSYLMRGEGAEEDKTTLAQKDIRFARTIQRLQRSLISELQKIGLIHLFILGYRNQDLLSFELKLNNPSKISELQELDYWKTKLDVAAAAAGMEGFFSKRFIASNFFQMSEEEFKRELVQMHFDKKFQNQLESSSQQMSSLDGSFDNAGIEGNNDIFGDMNDISLGGMGGKGEENSSEVDAGLEDLLSDEPEEETGLEAEDTSLLVTPDENEGGETETRKADPSASYTTSGSKGKEYTRVRSDGRRGAARNKSASSQAGNAKGGVNKDGDFSKLFKGMFLHEGLDKQSTIYDSFREKEMTNKEFQDVINSLGQTKKFNKEGSEDEIQI